MADAPKVQPAAPETAASARCTPYGQALPSVEEVGDRVVALAMGHAIMFLEQPSVLGPIATAVRRELQKQGVDLSRHDQRVRKHVNDNRPLIEHVLQEVERCGISPDGIILPLPFDVEHRYMERYEEWCSLGEPRNDPEKEALLCRIVDEVRTEIFLRARIVVAPDLAERQLHAAIERVLHRASRRTPLQETQRPPALAGTTSVQTPGSFVNMHLSGRALAGLAAAALVAAIGWEVVRSMPQRAGVSRSALPAEVSASAPTRAEDESYRQAIFAKDGKIEDAVIIRVGNILRENSGSLHLTQIFDIYDWIKTQIRYLNVLEGHEPREAGLTLAAGQGDCKNMAALFASMTTSIGARTAIALMDGHAYNFVRVETAANSAKYGEVKARIAKTVLRRYKKLNPQAQRIAFFEDGEGLWLSFDATYERDGYPGITEGKPIRSVVAFGSSDKYMALR